MPVKCRRHGCELIMKNGHLVCPVCANEGRKSEPID